MIPRTEFFNWIDDYSLEQLNEKERSEFEAEMQFNNELKEEVNLQKEIQSAIAEKDILILRGKLENIATQNDTNKNETESFKLLDDFANIQEITETLAPEDLINFYDSLPKAHVYHHELTSDENVHQFYKEQDKSSEIDGEEDFSDDFDFEEFDGLEEAILEKDILNLRDTLSQVAKSVKLQFSDIDIDNYINGELKGKDLELFENELNKNRKLQKEVELHLELNDAVLEKDVLNLRSQLTNITETETSWNVSKQSIEDFIDGVLEEELLDEFNVELNENTDLMAEVSLRKKVNESIGEKDIFSLRDELTSARLRAETKEIKSIVPETNFSIQKLWRSSAAILIFLIGIAGVLNNNGFSSLDKVYDNYYVAPEWGAERSVTTELSYYMEGNSLYVNNEYLKAIKVYDKALLNVKNNKYIFNFYKGASLQNLGRYQEAITEFNQVINDGNNMYIEEAEWYKSLCYLKLGNSKMARNELLAIVNRKGSYENDAKAVIRRLKYSIK